MHHTLQFFVDIKNLKIILESCAKETTLKDRDRPYQVYLCAASTRFSSIHSEDEGWGCGYRNWQMLFSSYNGLKNPSILDLQVILDKAWKDGYDTVGADQLKKCIIRTTKWIGATEIVAGMRSLGIHAKLVDFWRPTGFSYLQDNLPLNSRNDQEHIHVLLFKWVWEYFARKSKLSSANKDDNFVEIQEGTSCLYLQHQGHSRTIVGVERTRADTINLLLCDPSLSREQIQWSLMPKSIPNDTLHKETDDLCHQQGVRLFPSDISDLQSPVSLLNTVWRHSLSTMTQRQYQIVYLEGPFHSQKMQQSSKVIRSQPIP